MAAVLRAFAGVLMIISASGSDSGQEPFSWKSRRIIDIHGHNGSFKGYDLDTSTLMENIGRFGLDMVLISNIDGAELPGTTLNLDETAANKATAALVGQHREKLRGLAWTRPRDGAAMHLLPFLEDSITFVGMKFHPMMNHFPADDPCVDPYLALCERFGIPAVFHSDKPGTNGDPQRIYAAARRYPTVPVILYHMVFFGPHTDAIDVVEASARNNDANLYLETAQASPDDVVRAIRRVGSRRVLFGSDATYFGRDHYARYTPLLTLLKDSLSDDELADVLERNALRLFRIP